MAKRSKNHELWSVDEKRTVRQRWDYFISMWSVIISSVKKDWVGCCYWLSYQVLPCVEWYLYLSCLCYFLNDIHTLKQLKDTIILLMPSPVAGIWMLCVQGKGKDLVLFPCTCKTSRDVADMGNEMSLTLMIQKGTLTAGYTSSNIMHKSLNHWVFFPAFLITGYGTIINWPRLLNHDVLC